MNNAKRTILTLNGNSFKHYLLLRYVTNSSNPRWKLFKFLSADKILPEIWIQLLHYARADVESQGGRLACYEIINERLIEHQYLQSDFWPSNWMWVISKNC